ncbi:MAG: hypothetical protein P8N76_28515 [Pirellulaceae bacterium]|nr:hypothetical protein [Pirellulaceae bacterium]
MKSTVPRSKIVAKIVLFMVFLVAPRDIANGDQGDNLLIGHPRPSYDNVKDIDAMAAALRKSLAERSSYSFSRGWWNWDRLRCRYVDGGRKSENELKILAAVFRGLILDWHAKLEAKGEGDLLYIFFTTVSGDKRERVLDVDSRTLLRDVHGGGYHGSWGSAARMRIYQELAASGVLTEQEQARFKRIVYQSLEPRFIDFKAKTQSANNHSFGNAGGVALAVKLFPDAPQAPQARAWLDRIWNHLAEFGDWKEWNYYPYGPIFLHGMLDVAEATDRIDSDRKLIKSVGHRCLGFVHGGGVRGNPNSGVRMRKTYSQVYADPWNFGYYDVEQSARDGQFWYRLAQHYKDSEYLWAAEQVTLGGCPPNGKVPAAYQAAYQRRFAWFIERGIEPQMPTGRASVGLLSATNHKIHERIYLRPGQVAGNPIAAFFLYDKKDQHLDNVSGHLYEYSAKGAKLLNSSGKYNNVYSDKNLRGGGSGEESLDLLLVMHKRHKFPLHPDRQGDERDYMRRGSIRSLPELSRAENNDAGDSFGQFAFEDYYGPGSRWIRRAVLTHDGYLVVADEYVGGKPLGDDYVVGPVWHLAIPENEQTDDTRNLAMQDTNWFDGPAFAQAWWQKDKMHLLLYIHQDGVMNFGKVRQRHSQDSDPNITCFGWRPIQHGETERFLSVLVPHTQDENSRSLAATIKTQVTKSGNSTAQIDGTSISIDASGVWNVLRQENE